MIGCGHVENGNWQFAQFTVDALTEGHEAGIVDAWFAHMAAVRQRLDPDTDEPRLFHWSHHEPTQFETAYSSAKVRHEGNSWPTPRWFDFYREVTMAQPVVVRGSLEFSLKPVAKALNRHGLTATVWGDGPTDGLGAMVGAWSCAREAAERGCTLPETELMQEIGRYNEVDCKVMMEIVQYLRSKH